MIVTEVKTYCDLGNSKQYSVLELTKSYISFQIHALIIYLTECVCCYILIVMFWDISIRVKKNSFHYVSTNILNYLSLARNGLKGWILTLFFPMFPFHNLQKTFGFLMFSGGPKRSIRNKRVKPFKYYSIILSSQFEPPSFFKGWGVNFKYLPRSGGNLKN